MQRRRIATIAAVVLVLLAVYWWWWGRPVFLPFGSNSFVETVTISRLTPLPTVTERTASVPIDNAPEQNLPFEDPIEVPAGGRYLRIDLKRYESLPWSIGGRDVMEFGRWVLTFAVYRPGDPQGEGYREFQCWAPEGTITPDPRGTPGLPMIGHGLGGENYLGEPILDLAEPGHNLFWAFVRPPPGQDEPLGEYVYEVRLYPTAEWVSEVRAETGDPIVLRRGTLIVVEEPTADDGEHPG